MQDERKPRSAFQLLNDDERFWITLILVGIILGALA